MKAIQNDHYTYRVTWSADVHRELTVEATEAGVSLNRLATVKLAH